MDLTVPYLDLKQQLASLRPEIDAAISLALDRSSFCLGPDVVDFEKEFAINCQAKYALGFNSGTSALHVAMRLLDIGPGDEVITTPFTFVATSWAISYVGAKPVYVDIDEATFNLNPRRVERAVTARTKAILPVHLYGLPCAMDEMLAIGKPRGLPIVEDAAQAHEAEYKGRRVGAIGAMGAFSFYPAKNLGACGEGGALVTNDVAFAARARSLREHGSTTRYFHDEVGYNYRMEGIQGAVLRVKLKHLARWTEARRKIAARYLEGLSKTPLRLPVEPEGYRSAWHLFVVRHPKRDALKDYLQQNGIGSALHYPRPLHLQKCYEGLGYAVGDFPVAESAAAQCLAIPIFPELTDTQVDRVIEVIQKFFEG